MSVDSGIFGNFSNTVGNFGNSPTFLSNRVQNNDLFDLGLAFEYKDPLWSAYVNFIKNFGGFDVDPVQALPAARGSRVMFSPLAANAENDYDGWMVDAGASLYCGPFTFNVGGFAASGAEFNPSVPGIHVINHNDFDLNNMFRYPAGRSHYWSEILGLGTLDASVNGVGDRIGTQIGYSSMDGPSNLWMVTLGAAWQALEGTKLTFNYYYIGTLEDVVAETPVLNLPFAAGGPLFVPAGLPGATKFDNSIGHELDFYVDQRIVDKLNLRLVGAVLLPNDGYTTFRDDDTTYELGAQLLWAF